MTELPERINAIRTMTYDVPAIVRNIQEKFDISDPTLEDVMEWVEEWAYEDLSSYPSRHDLVYQDENGNEL